MTTNTYETILFEVEGPVAQITINRPDKLNALNDTVLTELWDAIMNRVDDSVRVVRIESAGEKAFVAGADIGPMREMSPIDAQYFSRKGQMIFRSMEKMPQIFVAKVQGFALGGGCELAMACDIIVASEKAKFGQPEVNLGIIAGFGGTQRLVKRVGLPVAIDMLCTGKGRTLSGEEAFKLGLVSRVVAPEKLDEEVDSVVRSILESGIYAVSESKRLCREALEMSTDAGMSAEAAAFGNCFATSESEEGINAFLEKRKPEFH